MYGYRLNLDESEEPLVYYNVSFYGSSTVLSYPEWCVRKLEPRPVPRADPRPVMETFLKDIVNSNPTLFGTNLMFNAQPINICSKDILPSSVPKVENFGWSQPPVPFRKIDQTLSQHTQAWKVSECGDSEDKNVDNKENLAEVKSFIFSSSDDSGYETQNASLTPSTPSQPPPRIKPTFMSKLLMSRCKKSPEKSSMPAKPDFLSRMLMSGSSSKAPSISPAPTMTPLATSSPTELSSSIIPKKPNFANLAKQINPVKLEPPSKRQKQGTNHDVPESPSSSSNRKKPTVSDVNIDKLLSEGKEKEISKLNVATLLDYCRKANLKEAKAKSKKEDLLNLILSKKSIQQ